jgi:hypothetical protein
MKDHPVPVAPHGTRARYCHWTEPCRCPACREANRRYMVGYRSEGPKVRGPYKRPQRRPTSSQPKPWSQPELFR